MEELRCSRLSMLHTPCLEINGCLTSAWHFRSQLPTSPRPRKSKRACLKHSKERFVLQMSKSEANVKRVSIRLQSSLRSSSAISLERQSVKPYWPYKKANLSQIAKFLTEKLRSIGWLVRALVKCLSISLSTLRPQSISRWLVSVSWSSRTRLAMFKIMLVYNSLISRHHLSSPKNSPTLVERPTLMASSNSVSNQSLSKLADNLTNQSHTFFQCVLAYSAPHVNAPKTIEQPLTFLTGFR